MKATAYYQPSEFDRIDVGFVAIVEHVFNHPTLGNNNGEPVFTSTVIAITEEGFETRNTLYRIKK